MAAALLLGVLWYSFLIVPLQEETRRVRQEIEALILERNRGRQAQRALPELRAAIAALQAERQAFLRALPREERLGEVLQEILGEAVRSGVVVRAFNRSPTTAPIPEVRAVNLALTVEGPFPETFTYLRSLEGLSRFVTLSGPTLSARREGEEPILNADLTLSIYMLAKEVQVEGGKP